MLVLHVAFFPLLTTQHKHACPPPPGRGLFFFSLCTLSVLLCPNYPGLCLLFPYCTKPANIYAPGGIRTCNSSRRAASDPRFRPLGHWDRRIRTRDPGNRVASDIRFRTHSDGHRPLDAPSRRQAGNSQYNVTDSFRTLSQCSLKHFTAQYTVLEIIRDSK